MPSFALPLTTQDLFHSFWINGVMQASRSFPTAPRPWSHPYWINFTPKRSKHTDQRGLNSIFSIHSIPLHQSHTVTLTSISQVENKITFYVDSATYLDDRKVNKPITQASKISTCVAKSQLEPEITMIETLCLNIPFSLEMEIFRKQQY